jgi:hypothetical protein
VGVVGRAGKERCRHLGVVSLSAGPDSIRRVTVSPERRGHTPVAGCA